MNTMRLVLMLSCLGLLAGCASDGKDTKRLVAFQEEELPEIRSDGASPSESEMLAAWQNVSTPGLYHTHLLDLVGEWDALAKFWFMPDAEPSLSTSTTINRMDMGGRFMMTEMVGDMAGTPFVGRGIWGYNNAAGRYESSWIDSMSTALMFSTGTCDESGRVFTMNSVGTDPISMEDVETKTLFRILDRNQYIMEMWVVEDDGEWRTLQIVYTRKR